MKQIMTGPLGLVAYHNTSQGGAGQYPALNIPSRDFMRGDMLVAANEAQPHNVIVLTRQMTRRAAVAMYSTTSAQREN